ncbi:DUF1963 domain-containing protein [Neolewinella sp.]|uniref:DUF1963 domain-containing protein n=1 Tax=Neolewinella sp. TaxID=2993543 RepID=UPI003B52627E
MTIPQLKAAIARPTVPFATGGFRPTNAVEESWIGRVTAFGEGETVPTDVNGKPMIPLAQFYLADLPYLPPALKGVTLLTFFLSITYNNLLQTRGETAAYPHDGAYYVVREYRSLPTVHPATSQPEPVYIKPFPLRPEPVRDDYPIWDGGGLSPEMEREILRLERDGTIENYYDITEHDHRHKVGGYPSFCQSGIMGYGAGFGEGFEFVLQISSDAKAGLNVIDGGSLMFARQPERGAWSLYFDFY